MNERIKQWINNSSYEQLIEQAQKQIPPSADSNTHQPEQAQKQEPVAWMFQHEETGRMNYISNDGMNTPELFLKMNPRYVFVCALYTTPPQKPKEQAQKFEGHQEPVGASEETQRFAIEVEKLLCEKLERKWSPVGMSIQTLVDELASRTSPPQQKQEPISTRERWNIERDGDDLLVCFNDHEKGEGCRYERYVLGHTTPLQRQWVGLTDKEIVECWARPTMWATVHAIEAKLKQKNGIKGEA